MKEQYFKLLLALCLSFWLGGVSANDLRHFIDEGLGRDVEPKSMEEIKEIFGKYGASSREIWLKIKQVVEGKIQDPYSDEMYKELGGYIIELSIVPGGGDETDAKIIEYLLSRGVDPFQKNLFGTIPIFNAVILEDPVSLPIMLEDSKDNNYEYIVNLRDLSGIEKKNKSLDILNNYLDKKLGK